MQTDGVYTLWGRSVSEAEYWLGLALMAANAGELESCKEYCDNAKRAKAREEGSDGGR